jgi:hypothetical protein
MSPAQVVLLVVGIVTLVALIQAAVWIPIARKLRRMPAMLRDELAASGERVIRAPEKGVYRGSIAREGGEVGFFATDPTGWASALRSAAGIASA